MGVRYAPQGPPTHCQFDYKGTQRHRCRGRRVGDPLCAEGIPKRHCHFEFKGAQRHLSPSDAPASPSMNELRCLLNQ